MHRVCKPGGRIILVTWVHRNLEENEALKPKDGLVDSGPRCPDARACIVIGVQAVASVCDSGGAPPQAH